MKKIILIVGCCFVCILLFFTCYKSYIKVATKEYLIDKYGFNKEELNLKEVKLKHKELHCIEECFSSTFENVPTYVKFEYDDTEIIVVFNGNFYDDYLVKDLYYGVKNYYSNMFGIEDENIFYQFVDFDDYLYIDYIYNNNFSKVDYNVVNDFLFNVNNKISNEIQGIEVYIKLDKNDNLNEYIMKIENNLKKLRYNERIILFSEESEFYDVEVDGGYDTWGDVNSIEYSLFNTYYASQNKDSFYNPYYYNIKFIVFSN